MSEQKQFRAIKGTRDVLPWGEGERQAGSAVWEWFERTAREVFESYGFGEIRTPIFEETSLFARSIGAETDVVNKEMYSFEDARGELLDLRESIRDYVFSDLRSQGEAPGTIGHFIGLLDEFVRKIDAGRSSGEVEYGPNAQHAYSTFASGIVHLKSILVNPSQTGTDFETTVKYIKHFAGFIEIGGSVSLRPEATAGICRAYIEHGMHTRPGNVKLYLMGPMFRRERPQKGRYRHFYQVDAEVLGQSDAPGIDAELIEMLLVLLRRVGLDKTKLYVNSIGDKNCRPAYVEKLREELRKVKDRLGADSQRRVETNPLRVLDSKVPEEQEIIAGLPRIADHLCPECTLHFAQLKEELRLRGIAYEENWRLVRGLDYYTRTTFEVTAEGLGSQNAVCGGGRYDGLVEMLGGPPTKGIGFAIGTDRAILSIEEAGSSPKTGGLGVYVAWMGRGAYPAAVEMARKLRDAGIAVELPAEEMKFKKSLGLADRLGAKYALIVGEDEVASRTFTLKRLSDANQLKLAEPELLEYLESERRGTRA